MSNGIFLIISLLMPLLMTIFGACRARDSIQKSAFFSMLSVVIANGAMSATALLLGGSLTQYELLLVNGVVSAGMAFFMIPCARARRFDPVQLLKAAGVGALIVALYSIVTIGQTCISGDTAAASLLTKAQVEHRSLFPESWCYADGDFGVLTVQTLVAPFAVLLKNHSLARMLGSALLLIFAVTAVICHSKKILQDDSWVVAVPMFLVLLAGMREEILYRASDTPLILWISVYPWLFFLVQTETQNRKNQAILALLTVAMTMGGTRMLTELVLPLWGAYFVLTYLRIRGQEENDWKQEGRELLRVSGWILLPALVGTVIFFILRSTHHMTQNDKAVLTFVGSSEACVKNLLGYFADLFACFGFSGGAPLLTLEGVLNVVLVLAYMTVVLAVPILQGLRLKEETAYVQFFYAFTVVHNLAVFLLAMLIEGKQDPRQLLTSVFLWVILSARYIYLYWIRQEHFEKYIWSCLIAAAVLVAALSLSMKSMGWEEKLDARKEISRQLVEQGYTKGYGNFQTAYGQEVYSDFAIRFGGLDTEDGVPRACYRLVEADAFAVRNSPTFLMLTEQENREKALSLLEYFEEPVEHLLISGYHIYLFDYDIASDLQ